MLIQCPHSTRPPHSLLEDEIKNPVEFALTFAGLGPRLGWRAIETTTAAAPKAKPKATASAPKAIAKKTAKRKVANSERRRRSSSRNRDRTARL